MKKTRTVSRLPVLAFAALGLVALLPTKASAQKNAGNKDDSYYNFLEVDAFAGALNYFKVGAGLGTQLGLAGQVGGRLTENAFNYFGIEESVTAFSTHQLDFGSQVRPGVSIPSLTMHSYQGAVNAVGYLTPRGSKYRPFFTAGLGGASFFPTSQAKGLARTADPTLNLAGLRSDSVIQGNLGVGVKIKFSPRVGMRLDLRGLIGKNPTFGLPAAQTTNGVYIPGDKKFQGIQGTIGLDFYFGHRGEAPAPPPPPPPPPPPTPASLTAGSITASATSVCPGETIRFSSNASVTQGHALTYRWSIDGSAQSGSSSDFSYTPTSSGDYSIAVRVTDSSSEHPASPVDVSAISIHVKSYSRPTVSGVTATPSEVERGATSAVHATAMGSECSGSLSFSWAASEGTVSGSGADGTFNSSSVSFNEGDRSRPQSKRVNITATVTDSKGGTGTASATVTVDFGAQVKHFGDILFPKNSSRVNNCGKRVLIEQLYPMLASNSNYDVVLVGHIDASEAPKGKRAKASTLDRARVLNTAGVLSGGSGTCTSLDRSRIKGSWVGSAQDSEFIATSCSVSTEAPKERRGNEIGDVSDAKNRRVEIWLIPKGMALPAGARDAKDLPDAEMTKIGCPK